MHHHSSPITIQTQTIAPCKPTRRVTHRGIAMQTPAHARPPSTDRFCGTNLRPPLAAHPFPRNESAPAIQPCTRSAKTNPTPSGDAAFAHQTSPAAIDTTASADQTNPALSIATPSVHRTNPAPGIATPSVRQTNPAAASHRPYSAKRTAMAVPARERHENGLRPTGYFPVFSEELVRAPSSAQRRFGAPLVELGRPLMLTSTRPGTLYGSRGYAAAPVSWSRAPGETS